MKAREFLLELDDNDISYYSPQEDDLSRFFLSNTRKPRITLRHLNRLKKIRATRAAENLMKQDLLRVMYGIPDESTEGSRI